MLLSLLGFSPSSSGFSRRMTLLSMRCYVIVICLIHAVSADTSTTLLETSSMPPSVPMDGHAIADELLPANMPLFHDPWKHFPPNHPPKMVHVPAASPPYSDISSAQPPTSSQFSKPSRKRKDLPTPAVGLTPPSLVDISPTHSRDCCKQDMVMRRGVRGCHCVYPIKIDLLLVNVSQNPNWNLFLEELASQLGLRVSQIELINFYFLTPSRLNISMDITPHTGNNFSAEVATAINSSLTTHKVILNPTFVGDYILLNFTWFKPPNQSEVPTVAVSPTEGTPHKPAPTSASVNTPEHKRHSNLSLIIGIGVGILIIVIISILLVCFCTSRQGKTIAYPVQREKPITVDVIPSGRSFPQLASTRFIAYEDLKEATNNFETTSVLGEGGFGRVFKGVLSDGTAVAIKKLTTGGQQGDKEFLVEVEMLSRLHHRNLVKLVGYYSNKDSSQNLLCYELVPNGSLEGWLHGPLGVNCPLDWDTRMKIALDAARGLAYLHEDSQPCVIHRDFKASNILLENNFHAKVADFGLAKQAPEGRANYLSTRVMGTFGYVAPEYAMTGHLLVKSDVYSYGVVLLELLTGRKPVDMSQPSGQENLVTWARPILRDKERLDELADPRLVGNYPKEDFVRVCTIAAACVAPEASQRPTMGEVVQSLKMVQRVTEYQDSTATNRPYTRQSYTTFESDGTSSMFSSGPYSGLSGYENDPLSRTAVLSEDLHEGR
uniref:Protein kinase domain-containing protein n=1 Tax=Kalanchoe fedtschenkoi TaxID=63787 RepID=A0A7N1A8I1_KALFE